METKPITIETILSLYKNLTEEKRPKQIKSELTATLYPDVLLVEPHIEQYISECVDKILREDKKEKERTLPQYFN